MDFELRPIKELYPRVEMLFKEKFELDDYDNQRSIKVLANFLTDLRDDIIVGIESKYVDKLYRDEYYHYYSSKLEEYKRDCIRLSFFETGISSDDFYSAEGVANLQKRFFGFLVLRPTAPKVIGRNALRPDIFVKTLSWHAAIAPIGATITGIKLSVEAFPHASQDEEFMVCAETTLWASMEYFANRYPEYRPVLPKKIHTILSHTSMQRQIPSSGLTGLQMSFALKEAGFGVKMYGAAAYGDEPLLRMIKMYVESGIPVIAALSNSNGINHVINITGRTDFEYPAGFGFTAVTTLPSGNVLYDYYDQPCRYLGIDDNFQPYKPIPLDNPAFHYLPANVKWEGCKIAAAIVPLHERIYMEADRARKLAHEALIIQDSLTPLPTSVVRVLLSSSRSFKHSVSLNKDITKEVKTVLINLDMPKFVWIAETGTPDSFSANKATGMILMDATEPKKRAILASLLENAYIGPINGLVNRYSLPLQPFSIHRNLKLF